MGGLRWRWFLPRQPDLCGMLADQGRITEEGLRAFQKWSWGEDAEAASVREAEHRADTARHDLRAALRQAFTTPLDPEDLYELSERTDEVLNGAKNTVREAELMDMPPDPAMGEMADDLLEATTHLSEALAALNHHSERATEAANATIKCQRNLERTYRKAMSALLSITDLKEAIGRRELYRRYARVGDSLVRAAERVWYAVIKQA